MVFVVVVFCFCFLTPIYGFGTALITGAELQCDM